MKIRGTKTARAPNIPTSIVLFLPSLPATNPAGMAKTRNASEKEVSTMEEVPGSIPRICCPYREKKVSTALKPVNQKNMASSIKIRLLFLPTSFLISFSFCSTFICSGSLIEVYRIAKASIITIEAI